MSIDIGSSIDKVTRSLQSDQARLEAIREEEVSAYSLGAPKSELSANIRTSMAELARHGRESYEPVLIAAESGGIDRFPGRDDRLIPPGLPPALSAGRPVTMDLLMWILEEILGERQVCDGWDRAVQRMTYAPGPPIRDRLPRLARLATERDAIQEKYTAKVDELRAAGLDVPHLPEEHGRRVQALQRAEAEARNAQANAGLRRYRGDTPA